MTLKSLVENDVRRAVLRVGGAAETPIHFEIPRQQGHGHLISTIAMSLAKDLRKAPRMIAQEIVDALGTIPMVESVQVAGAGFLNITFTPEAFHTVLTDLALSKGEIGQNSIGMGRTVNVEYVSANPTGPLHAGHGRNCALGDTIANILQWSGYTVTREYYFNNAGNQMNKLGESIAARLCEQLGKPEVLPFPEDGYHGEYIVTIAKELADRKGNELNSVIDSGNMTDLKAVARKAGEEWCFQAIKKTLQTLNINHDVYFNEDSLYSSGRVEQTIQQLRNRNLAYDKDGAVWFALSALPDDGRKTERQDKVIVKSSGEPTYRLPDIAYHVQKLERGFDVLVDIFGADHIATIPDVLAGVQALGFDAGRVRVVIHQMVTFMEDGEVVKFSKRSGKSFTLDDLIDEVGADVVRFFFVMRAPGTHLDFDLDLAKEEGEKNPVFYLQYAHARICSILRKAPGGAAPAITGVSLKGLTHAREIELITLLSRFQEVVERAAESLEPHIVAEYLRDLAATYHQFYHDCRILGSGDDTEPARLILADVTRRALKNGLTILGVTAPESM